MQEIMHLLLLQKDFYAVLQQVPKRVYNYLSLDSRVMEKYVNLKTSGVYALTVTDKFVACACSEGVIRF